MAPSGSLSFINHETKMNVRATNIDTFTAAKGKATFTGRALVNDAQVVSFAVEVEDLGEPNRADTFRIVLGDGFGAGGVLLSGNIEVEGGL